MLVQGTAVPLEAERNKFETGTARIPHNLSDGNGFLRAVEVEAKEKMQTCRKLRCPLAFDKSPVRLLEVREVSIDSSKQFGVCVPKVSVVNVPRRDSKLHARVSSLLIVRVCYP
jgi:hypothetical protein